MDSSIHVAPLHIVKSTSDLALPASGLRSSPASMQEPRSIDQITPPQTPQEASQRTHHESHEANVRSSFHNYLRAFCPFRPPTSVSSSTVTLPLNAGNIVLVHSIHINGWADGTLLDTGARGWLPTNYCEVYEHIPMRPLLKALTDFSDVMRGGYDATRDIFRNQDHVRGLIAGVRFLLEKSDCLTRDSSIVQNNDSIRRARKALLSDLSSLVKMAKALQEHALGGSSRPSGATLSGELILKAFKIVTRGVRFLDVWNEDVGLDCAIESVSAILGRKSHDERRGPLTPPAESRDEVDRAERRPTTATRSSLTRKTLYRQSIGHDSTSSPSGHRPASRQGSASIRSHRTSLTHRMTSGGYATGPANPNLASERLRSSHDVFLGCLGTFLGLHMQSRSSADLLLTTQQSVKSCRELLTVIEVVLHRDRHRSESLMEAKDAMYDNIAELVHAAREVFHPASPSSDEDVEFVPDQGQRLVGAARDCVRGAGECVAMTRSVLERIGNFEPEAAELQSSIASIGSPRSSRQLDGASEYSGIDSEEQGEMEGTTESELRDRSAPLEHAAARFEELESTISPSSLSTPRFEPHASLEQPDSRSRTPTERAAGSGSLQLGDSLALPSMLGTAFIPEVEIGSFESDVNASLRDRQVGSYSTREIVNSAGSQSTNVSNGRDSEMSAVSLTSTRATSPGGLSEHREVDETISRVTSSQSTFHDESEDAEAKLMEKTFVHELMYNKEGQIVGGSLPALIERLTAHHSTPDAVFVSTFYLTFRQFASPPEFAQALAYRFRYISETPTVAGPVQLRVYNVFKGWLESHWRHDCDDVALPFILDFAHTSLGEVLPSAGKRLAELADKVASAHSPLVPRLVSSIGKTNTSIAQYVNPDSPVPAPIISKSQLAALRAWKMGGSSTTSILDFDPLELARQITIKESVIFCSILPEELLATEWMKRSGSLAVNVRAKSTLSTDLANLVADSILSIEEPKKRAAVIKQWVKIAQKCVDLKNFDSLMAIICSLNSTMITRLKKTWEVVSQKTKATLEEATKIVDVAKNYSILRQRLQNQVPPCVPFVGIYLTDLTFVDHGNPTTRQMNTEDGSIGLINFDKHMKTAKIISELQRFQIPYRLAEVPELQTWMQDQLVRVRSGGEKSFQSYYRRSLVLEPREQMAGRITAAGASSSGKPSERGFDFLSWAHTLKDKPIATNG